MDIQFGCVNGVITTQKEMTLHVSDLTVMRGYGVFDFLVVEQQVPLFLDAYLERFVQSADALDLPVPRTKRQILQDIKLALRANQLNDCGVRLLLTGGVSSDDFTSESPVLMVIPSPLKRPSPENYRNGVSLLSHQHRRDNPQTKHLNYASAVSQAKRLKHFGAYELLYHFDGKVSEASRSNLFIVKDKTIITPAQDVLPGIVRAQVLGLATGCYSVKQQTILLSELASADEVFITGSSKRIVPVCQIDRQQIGEGTPGPVTRHLMSLYQQHVEQEVQRYQKSGLARGDMPQPVKPASLFS